MGHEIQVWTEVFAEIAAGFQTFFIARDADGRFKRGDVVVLREWDVLGQRYTGRDLQFTVGVVASGGAHGPNLSGFAVLSLVPVAPSVVARSPLPSSGEGRQGLQPGPDPAVFAPAVFGAVGDDQEQQAVISPRTRLRATRGEGAHRAERRGRNELQGGSW